MSTRSTHTRTSRFMRLFRRLRRTLFGVPSFAVRRRAVMILHHMPAHQRLRARMRCCGSMVDIQFGRPSWYSPTLNLMVDGNAVHYWLYQGDRGSALHRLQGPLPQLADRISRIMTTNEV